MIIVRKYRQLIKFREFKMKRAFLLSLIVIAFSTSYAKEESDVALKVRNLS